MISERSNGPSLARTMSKPVLLASAMGAVLLAASIGAHAQSPAEPPNGVMLMNRIGPSKMELFISNADGTGERKLVTSKGLDYDGAFSADGKWVVFTSERDAAGVGQADIYRVHPDGTGLERLTFDTAMEDAGVLSPDGTKLAYVSTKGGGKTTNIWVMDLKTKKAKQLTGSTATAPSPTMNSYFRPAWSPDGAWIAYTSDAGEKWAGAETGAGVGHSQPLSLYVMRSDGSGVRRITQTGDGMSTGSPSWSPDGKSLLAYEIATKSSFDARMGGALGTRTSGSQIVRIDVASGAKTVLTTGAELKVAPHFIGPAKIGYSVRGGPKENAQPQGISYTDGQRGPMGMVRNPSWSPDGKTVVYYRFDIKNLPQYTKLYSWDKTREYRYTDVFPTICPGSGKLAITDLDFPFGNPNASVSVMNPDGSDRKKVFQRQDGAALLPTWSPDCKKVAFGFGVFFGGRSFRPANIRVVNADGSDTQELHSDGKLNVGFPAWSPDGKTMLYRVWGKDADGKDQRGLRALNLADKTVKVVTTEWDNFPFYSPSGDRVVFTRQLPNTDFEVFTMKPDGTDQKRVTTTAGADAHATWSIDGKELWFESSRTGFKDESYLFDNSPQPYAQIFLMNRDGSNVRQMSDSRWEDSMGTYLRSNADRRGRK